MGKQVHDLVKSGKGFEAFQVMIQAAADGKGIQDPNTVRATWEKATAIAEKYDKPGVFTELFVTARRTKCGEFPPSGTSGFRYTRVSVE